MASALAKKAFSGVGVTVKEFRCYHAKKVVELFLQGCTMPFGDIVEPKNLQSRLEQLDGGSPNSYWAVGEFDKIIVVFGGIVWYKTPSVGLEGSIRDIVIDKNLFGRKEEAAMVIVSHLLHQAQKVGLTKVELAANNVNCLYPREVFGFVQGGSLFLKTC